MTRAWAICPAGHWDTRVAVDRVTLPSAANAIASGVAMTAEAGLAFVLDLEGTPVLRHGDGLVLDDGRVVMVNAPLEPGATDGAHQHHHDHHHHD